MSQGIRAEMTEPAKRDSYSPALPKLARSAVDVLGPDAARRAMNDWRVRVQHEVLTLHPANFHSNACLQEATETGLNAVQRDVSVRSIYEASSRADPRARDSQDTSARHGAEIRLIAQVPMRMVVFDRVAGIVPNGFGDGDDSWILLRGTRLTLTLVLCFEQLWAKAEPLEDRAARCSCGKQADPTVPDRILLSLLATGIKDETAARQLGVSVRTIRRQIADLMFRLESGSRFQAGISAALRGWVEVPYCACTARPAADPSLGSCGLLPPKRQCDG